MKIDRILAEDIPSVRISCPQDLIKILDDFYDSIPKAKQQEIFVVVSLNGSHEISAINVVTVGTVNFCLVHPREVFKHAISNNASAVIIAHNHPSGNSDPSEQDINVTRMIYGASVIMGIELLDHIIIGEDYYSFKENRYFENLEKVLKNTAFYKDFIKE